MERVMKGESPSNISLLTSWSVHWKVRAPSNTSLLSFECLLRERLGNASADALSSVKVIGLYELTFMQTILKFILDYRGAFWKLKCFKQDLNYFFYETCETNNFSKFYVTSDPFYNIRQIWIFISYKWTTGNNIFLIFWFKNVIRAYAMKKFNFFLFY